MYCFLLTATSSLDRITTAVPSNDCFGTYRAFYFSDFIPHVEKVTQQNNGEKMTEKCAEKEEGYFVLTL